MRPELATFLYCGKPSLSVTEVTLGCEKKNYRFRGGQ